MQMILAVGQQDTDPNGLQGPPGIEILGNSSDHLVAESRFNSLSVGAEVRFQLNYSALVRTMTSPFVAKVMTGAAPFRMLGGVSARDTVG